MKRVLLVALMTLAGCATRYAQVSNSAVVGPMRAAQALQSSYRSPQAELHLQYAQDNLDVANSLDAKGYDERANLMRLRAKADAELAQALARGATLQGENERALRSQP
jgi:hypothetical protein